MLAGVLIIAFWAYLIWIWRVHQSERIGPVTGERRIIKTPARWR